MMNKFNKGKRGFEHKRERREFSMDDSPRQASGKVTIKELVENPAMAKSTNQITAVINSVTQTTGPSLFSVSDGTGTLVVKAFEGAGVRAYPNIEEDDCVEILLTVKEYQGMLEGDAMRMTKLSPEVSEKVKKAISDMQRAQAQAKEIPFLIKSKVLDKLKESFMKAATEIRLAIFTNRPIIVRHHNDADGYSSGYSVESAILPLLMKQHGGSTKALRTHYNRAPSNTPFYDIEDSIKDSSHSLTGQANFSEKIPLVVIVDTGSSEESLLGIQQGKIHGTDFIVVDHHFSEKDVISKEVLVHINPFLVGEDGGKYSAGMLCSELARFINPEASVDHIPALAGLADMIDNPEILEQYMKIAENKGYSKQLMHDISAVIDFVSTKLRFMEAREYVGVMFGNPIAQQKKLVSLLGPYVRNLENKSLEIAKSVVRKEDIGGKVVQFLYIEESFSRGVYPKPGRANGMLHDFTCKEGNKKVISLGILGDAITMRASEESKFSVHDLIKHLHKSLPGAFVEGGGHHLAGAIRFVPSQRENVLNAIRTFVKAN
ncbi:MAG: hypothetical protein AABX11_02795 [Nanoarchaeota archaeon]